MTTHSSILAWKIPWMEEPGRLQFMGLQRVRHDWATSFSFLLLKVRHSSRAPLGSAVVFFTSAFLFSFSLWSHFFYSFTTSKPPVLLEMHLAGEHNLIMSFVVKCFVFSENLRIKPMFLASHMSSFIISFLLTTAASSSPFPLQLYFTSSVNNLIRTSQGLLPSSWLFKCSFCFKSVPLIHSLHLGQVPHMSTFYLAILHLLLI